ncbi:MAG: serine hydrolase [Candidatus Coatesbacteria bacterium]|nr:serine hydrolase [Candidatus Coatesbacteria bacterium]
MRRFACVLLAASLLSSCVRVAEAREDILVADLEGDAYSVGKTTGQAFGHGPVRARRSHPTPGTSTKRLKQWLDESIPQYMRESKTPGFSLAIVQNGNVIYSEGFGLRDPQRNLPATPHTLYGIGSITKSFVAIGIMQLVEEGKIELDDPVSQHVPFTVSLDDDPIRIRHLLTHSLGLPSLATSSIAINRGLGLDTGIPFGSADDFYRFVNGAQDEIVAHPGERFFYHNAGWRILGHIIQVKSGMPFHRYIKERVINPLGMERTTLNVEDFARDEDHIVPHLKKADGTNESSRFPYPNPEDNPEFSFISAAGGILSSVDEMTRYLIVQIEKGAFGAEPLLSKRSFEQMQTLHIKRHDNYYGENGYGYGLDITPNFLGHKMVSHGGSVVVSTAYMAFIPDLRVGVIMMGNSSGMPYSTIAESIFALLMGHEPSEVLPSLKIKERMKSLTGTYKTYRELETVDVLIKSGMLYLKQESPLTSAVSMTPLVPEDPTLESTDFYILRYGSKTPVEFKIGDDGKSDLYWGRYCYHRVD